jgi:hypothetical protein
MNCREASLIVAQITVQASALDVPDGTARALVNRAVTDLLAAKSKLQSASRLAGEPQQGVDAKPA